MAPPRRLRLALGWRPSRPDVAAVLTLGFSGPRLQAGPLGFPSELWSNQGAGRGTAWGSRCRSESYPRCVPAAPGILTPCLPPWPAPASTGPGRFAWRTARRSLAGPSNPSESRGRVWGGKVAADPEQPRGVSRSSTRQGKARGAVVRPDTGGAGQDLSRCGEESIQFFVLGAEQRRGPTRGAQDPTIRGPVGRQLVRSNGGISATRAAAALRG